MPRSSPEEHVNPIQLLRNRRCTHQRHIAKVKSAIQQRQPKDYERAVILLMDLHDLGKRVVFPS